MGGLKMGHVAYILKGNKGLKVGQTNNIKRRVGEIKNAIVKAIIKVPDRVSAEVIESALRYYYVNDMNGTRIGTDWIADVEFDSNFMEDEKIKTILKIYNAKEIIFPL